MNNRPNRCVRKNFDRNGNVICKNCFQRDITIDSLREELKAVKAKIYQFENKKKQKITKKDLPEGVHTPSSARRFKTNSSLENQLKKGGAKKGHKGYGRWSGEADQTESISAPASCPCCHIALATKDSVLRTIVDVKPVQATRKRITIRRGQCPTCRKIFKGSAPVMPRFLYGNQLLSQALIMHYVHGISIGRILEVLGPEVTKGGLINAFHSFGTICAPAKEDLIEMLRKEEVRNADETGWRTDGQSGYAWIFRSQNITIFEHCDTRGSKIPHTILGEENLDGFLIVDRYNGYNRVPVKIQYCYAHLLREIKKLDKEFPDDGEVIRFTKRMGSLIAEAMKIQKHGLTPDQYLKMAEGIRKSIVKETLYPYQHLSIRYIQQIFLKHKKRLYHWAENPKVPADNNRAEREIRSTVLARKTSFGSQSKRGAKTRSNIMSVLLTAKKRMTNISLESWLYQTMNLIADNSACKIIDLIPVH